MSNIIALSEDHIPQMIELLVDKCEKTLQSIPYLKEKLSLEKIFEKQLKGFLENNPGYGLYGNNNLQSFLLGFTNIKSLKGKDLGSYIPIWGYTFSRTKHFLQLYKYLAKRWIESTVFTHLITYFPLSKELEEQLFTLGFGLLVIDGIRKVDLLPIKPLAEKYLIRPLATEDYQGIINIEKAFSNYLSSSPTFLYSLEEKSTSHFTKFLSKNRNTIVVEFKGKIVAAIRGILGESNFDIFKHPKNIAIDFAYTEPKFRGKGFGTHLVNEIMKWGISRNAISCTVDFESANLIANNFWLSLFTPIGFSAIRKIDNRL